MNLILYGFVALAILGTVAGIGYKVRQSGYDACKVEWSAANEKARAEEAAKGDTAAKALEKARSERRIIREKVVQYVDRNIEKLVVRDTCFTPVGVSCLNAIIAGKSADSCQPDGAVPAPIKPSGRHRGIRITMDTGSLRNLP